MKPSQLDILPAEQAAELLRKRSFWKRTMSVSLGIGLVLFAASYSLVFNEVIRERGNAPPPIDSEVFIYSGYIWFSRLKIVWNGMFMFFISGTFILFFVSFIRLLSLPRERKR